MRYINTMFAPLQNRQAVYQEILSMRKNIGSDLEDLKTSLDVADIEVSTYVPQSVLEKIAQATKSDAMLGEITEFIVHSWPETDAGLPEDL